ncbi:MAG: hypothetical protein ACYS30_18420 [Planctomycetota bacterium]
MDRACIRSYLASGDQSHLVVRGSHMCYVYWILAIGEEKSAGHYVPGALGSDGREGITVMPIIET